MLIPTYTLIFLNSDVAQVKEAAVQAHDLDARLQSSIWQTVDDHFHPLALSQPLDSEPNVGVEVLTHHLAGLQLTRHTFNQLNIHFEEITH